jgi:hypothetical protein
MAGYTRGIRSAEQCTGVRLTGRLSRTPPDLSGSASLGGVESVTRHIDDRPGCRLGPDGFDRTLGGFLSCEHLGMGHRLAVVGVDAKPELPILVLADYEPNDGGSLPILPV